MKVVSFGHEGVSGLGHAVKYGIGSVSILRRLGYADVHGAIWEFPKIMGTLFWVLIMRILLFRVPYLGPLFSETPKSFATSFASVPHHSERLLLKPTTLPIVSKGIYKATIKGAMRVL